MHRPKHGPLPLPPLLTQALPPPYHPASNHAQITALLPGFLASLQSLNLDLPRCLIKPLRPCWVTPDSSLPSYDKDEPIFDDFRPVICCTASSCVRGGEMDQGGYVQGAGDDTENWAHGLTPPVFWENVDELLEAAEADLPDLIARLVSEHQPETRDSSRRKELTRHISVCPLPLSPGPNECHVTLTSEATPKDSWIKSATYMQVGLGKSKAASRNMRPALPDICSFVCDFMAAKTTLEGPAPRAVIACDSGKDLSVGVALALSCYLFDEDGTFRQPTSDASFTKTLIKSRLGSIMTRYPEANPSRSTLQSVNSFLMDWRK